MKTMLTLALFLMFCISPVAVLAQEGTPIRVTNFSSGIGLGCFGRCGYLSIAFKVKNIAYHKKVGIFFRGNDGEWYEFPAYYSRPLENGFEEWKISTNFGERGQEIEFVAKYEVEGEVFWDNNFGQNFVGSFI